MEKLPPSDLVKELLSPTGYALIDVRSEGEFAEGRLPGFVNEPILNNSERHEVGLTYKHQGQEKAIEVGNTLIQHDKERRIAKWASLVASSPRQEGIITCWRGGLRSRTAAEWTRHAGHKVITVQDGYKGVRRELLSRFERGYSFLVLSGWTGTGKTRLLKKVSVPKVDLEGLANHRGSSFGASLFDGQPSQATFENLVALAIWDENKPYLVEDESIRIGQVVFPVNMKDAMRKSPFVILEAPLEERAQWIFDEYILEPFQKGLALERISSHFLKNLEHTRRRLGGLRYEEILAIMTQAFTQSMKNGLPEFPHHQAWIERLLVEHYDKTYQHAFDKYPRNVLFKGTELACAEFIEDYFRRNIRY